MAETYGSGDRPLARFLAWKRYRRAATLVGLRLPVSVRRVVCRVPSTVWQVEYDYFSYQAAQQQLVRAGDHFHRLMILIEIILILLAAPAATAGSICLEKSRGSLTHLFTTHLTSSEIVLGKLGARLLPILAILACALPVSIIATFMGGVDLLEAASVRTSWYASGSRCLVVRSRRLCRSGAQSRTRFWAWCTPFKVDLADSVGTSRNYQRRDDLGDSGSDPPV